MKIIIVKLSMCGQWFILKRKILNKTMKVGNALVGCDDYPQM